MQMCCPPILHFSPPPTHHYMVFAYSVALAILQCANDETIFGQSATPKGNHSDHHIHGIQSRNDRNYDVSFRLTVHDAFLLTVFFRAFARPFYLFIMSDDWCSEIRNLGRATPAQYISSFQD